MNMPEPQVCRKCTVGMHACSSTRCQCRCKELDALHPEVATVEEWRAIELRSAEIKAAMRSVEINGKPVSLNAVAPSISASANGEEK